MADVPKQEQIRRLNEKLRLFRRTALDVGDAGDCLFEAACEQYKQLPDQPPLHFMRSAQALREMIASWCRANREALAKSPIVASLAPDVKDPAKWDSYCKKIAKPFIATVLTPTRRTTSPSRPPSLRQTTKTLRLPSLGFL